MYGFGFLNDRIDGDTFMLLIVLYLLGARLVEGSPKLKLVGQRIAVAAVFLFVTVFISDWQPTTSDEYVAILLRSLVFAGIVHGAAWTVLPVLAFVYAHSIGAVFQLLKGWWQETLLRIERRTAAREQQRQAVEWERERPRREREAHDAAMRAEADARAREVAQKRREDARAECDALYALAAPAIGTGFTKQDCVEFVSKYMTDTAPPELVEARGDQLKGIIRHHWERIEPPSQSLKQLSEWYQQQLRELQSVPDEKLRKSLIARLNTTYSELTFKAFEDKEP